MLMLIFHEHLLSLKQESSVQCREKWKERREVIYGTAGENMHQKVISCTPQNHLATEHCVIN